ncbi:MAG: 3-oxoacyl-[acyl-carrier-protein] reductase [Chlamydiae bacterium]|nr:3-oxoacyl-[acyl-carrier-protein] reductase [Chlamydiota bacterium]
MKLLNEKRALITGGTAGIGRDIAIMFARQGASVAIFGTSQERALEVVNEMESVRVSSTQVFLSNVVNVSSKSSVDDAVQKLLHSWGTVDVLVNNAGITRDGLLMKMSEKDWDDVIDTNLKSAYNLCQGLVRSMLKAKSGKIINISSVVGLTGNAGQVNYCASKAGMIGFTKALAQELATRGICVNCIAPGFIQTKMTDVLTEQQKDTILKKIPMGKLGSTEDIANAAVFLASSLSNYITGQVLTVDGGMVM